MFHLQCLIVWPGPYSSAWSKHKMFLKFSKNIAESIPLQVMFRQVVKQSNILLYKQILNVWQTMLDRLPRAFDCPFFFN